MRLTNKAREELRAALRNLERAQTYIMREDIAVARVSDQATTTLHFTRKDGAALYPVEKEYGSDLCGLETGIARLASFLATH